MRQNFKIKLLILLGVIFFYKNVTAQNNDTLTVSEKLDSIYSLQKKMYVETKEAPLKDKNYGVELNLFRFLFLDKAFTLSGTYSLFGLDRKAEIAIPFYFQNYKNADDLTLFTLDCHYRYFLGKMQNGFYLSGFARYAYLRGVLGTDAWFGNASAMNKGDQNKLGIGFGIGYRKFSYRGLYWGTSISIGRYLLGKSDKFQGSMIDDDNEIIIDVELLKFGWAF